MGRRNQSPALLVVALLLSSAASPLVHGQQLLAPLSLITLGGRLCCSSTGNCLGNAPGIPGVLITMACNIPGLSAGAGYLIVGLDGTDLDGGFVINVYNLTNLNTLANFLALPCFTFFTLDVGVCPILNATRIVGYPSLLSTALSPLQQLVGNYWTQWVATSWKFELCMYSSPLSCLC